jgi:ABC-type branched-subunit amino acid transport system permease subunit
LWNSAPELYMILLGLLLIVFVLQVPDGIYGWLAPRLAPWFRKVRT